MSRGGENLPRNLAATCPKCNMLKRTDTAEEYLADLELGRSLGPLPAA
jgi:hypothetical protein